MNDVNSRQLASICINQDVIRDMPKVAAKFFCDLEFVCVRCEQLFVSNQFEYTGISYVFKELELGLVPVTYQTILEMIERDYEEDEEIEYRLVLEQ